MKLLHAIWDWLPFMAVLAAAAIASYLIWCDGDQGDNDNLEDYTDDGREE